MVHHPEGASSAHGVRTAAVPMTAAEEQVHGPTTLRELLWEDESGRLLIMEEYCRLIDTEVRARRGLRGATLRAGYRAVQRVQPGIIGYVIGKFAADWLDALEPFHRHAHEKAGLTHDVPSALVEVLHTEEEAAAEALLSVTDQRIKKARIPVQIAYSSLRSEAANNVLAAMPAFAKLLGSQVARASAG